MFRKRQPHQTSNMPAQQGNWGPPGYPGGAIPGSYPQPPAGSPQPMPGMAPQAPAAMITLLLLSADYRRAEELLRVLEHNVGQGRYAITWVGTIEDLLGAMGQRRYIACLLDLASPQVARLEGNYQLLGTLPYLAVLKTPSLSDGDPLLQQLDARGYYAYIGYPFDGLAVNQVLTDVFSQMAQMTRPPMPAQGNTSQGLPQHGSGAIAQSSLPHGPLPTPIGSSPAVHYQPAPYAPAPPPISSAPAPAPSPVTTPVMPSPPPAAPLRAGEALPPAPAPAIYPAPAPQAYPAPTYPVSAPPMYSAPQASFELAETVAVQPASSMTQMASTVVEMGNIQTSPATPGSAAFAPTSIQSSGVLPFAIQPQLIRHRGLFVCWSPFDGAQRTTAALNLATALAFGGFRTLVGELRRPAGPLASYLQLTEDELSRSLFAASSASERLMKQKGYVIDQELLENHAGARRRG